jgi:hypothetical protein
MLHILASIFSTIYLGRWLLMTYGYIEAELALIYHTQLIGTIFMCTLWIIIYIKDRRM